MTGEIKKIFGNKKIARKKRMLAVLVVFVAIFLFSFSYVKAATVNTGIEYGAYTGLAATDIRIIIAKIIRAVLGLLGLVALGFTIYGGYMYMTAGGTEEKIETAKKILKNMVIGLAIILSALAITQFFLNLFSSEYQASSPAEGAQGENAGFCVGCGFLGQVVESHYPARDAVNIPRNTKIVITFKQKMLPKTLIANTNGSTDGNGNPTYGDLGVSDGHGGFTYDRIKSDNIKIYRAQDGETHFLPNVNAFLSTDHKTIILKPQDLLGDGTRDFVYTVKLTSGVKIDDGSDNGADAFVGIKNDYNWSFTVSTYLDLTPPQVSSIIPMPSADKYPRNILVQVNFSEPVDPISASGIVGNGFRNIEIDKPDGSVVTGEFKIGNQYKTVEFNSDIQCGKNPCGQPIFCLPADTSVSTTVRSASIDPANIPQARIVASIYDGVVDMNGNSLNGGGTFTLLSNHYALTPGVKTETQWKQDKTLDNFVWKFLTSAQINTTAPAITATEPDSTRPDADGTRSNISATAPLTASFDKPMSVTTFNQILFKAKNPNQAVWYTPGAHNLNKQGNDISKISFDKCSPDANSQDSCQVDSSRAELFHGNFWQTPVGSTDVAIYRPFINSLVNDVYQNCFYPAENKTVGSGCEKRPAGVNDTNKSCYNRVPTNSTSTCAAGEICYLFP